MADSTTSSPDDQTTPPAEQPASAAEDTTANPRRGSRLGRFAWMAWFTMVVLFLAGQVWMWGIWDSPFGDAVKNLVTLSMALLSALTLVFCWILFAPVSRRATWLVALPVLLVGVGYGASIRKLEFTGDMRPLVTYRWEPTQDEILERHRESAGQQRDSLEVTLPTAVTIEATDMPAYRGAERTGVIVGPSLSQDWQSQPPRKVWDHPVGGGYSQFVVVGPLVITMEQRRDREAIVCYDAESGLEVWVHDYAARFEEAMGGPGPRSTPTVSGNRVLAVGALGDVHCLDLTTGAVHWKVNLLDQFGVKNTEWAMTSSPLVIDEMVVLNPGGPAGNGLVALKLEDGEVLWQGAGVSKEGEKNRAGYASPVVVTLDGVRQILNFDGVGLHGHDPATGEELWFHPFENGAGVNVAQPILFDDGRILISASYGQGSEMLRITKGDSEWNVESVWKNLRMRCKFTSPLLIDGYVYGLDEGILVCLDPESGDRVWKGGRSGLRGRYGHGQLLETNGQILALTEDGEIVLVQPDPSALVEVTSFRVLPEGRTWNPPALARGRVYVRNTERMACYDLRAPEATEVAVGTP